MNNGGLLTTVDESTISGGSVAGLLKFNNSDLTTARNLVGRMALAINVSVNAQHRLGVDANGNTGVDLFVAQTLPEGFPALSNTGNATVSTTVADPTAMVASDYELHFGAGGAQALRRGRTALDVQARSGLQGAGSRGRGGRERAPGCGRRLRQASAAERDAFRHVA